MKKTSDKPDSFTIGKTLAGLMHYLRPEAVLCIISLTLSVVTALGTLYVPILFGKAIDRVGTGLDAMAEPLIMAGIIVGITAILQFAMAAINNRISYRVVRSVRRDVFAKLQSLPMKYLDSRPRGELVSLMIADTDTLAEGLLLGFSQGFTGAVTIVGTIVYMWRLSRLTTLLVVLVTPLSLFVARFIAQSTHDRFLQQSSLRGSQTGLIDEMLGENSIVKSLGYESRAVDRFVEINNRLARVSLGALFMSSIVNPATRFVNSCVYALVALAGGFRVMANMLTVGSLTALLSYATQYTKPFNEISGVVTELQNALACGSRILALLEEPSEEYPAVNTGKETIDDGNVEITNVFFSYQKETPLIENFNIKVKNGMRVAIVGPTGCGKTTMINLLMGFLRVDQGEILVNGQDISTTPPGLYRSKFGMVLQDTWIKADTVAANIRLGREDATMEEVMAAGKLSMAHSFIKKLPQGYDTVLSENGDELSDGQKQLLSIARVMLKEPPILILDEATSSIDTRTEKIIQKALDRLMQGRTSFVVAHRLSTIVDADVIIAMKDGHIVEQGSHRQLMEKGGFYKELFNAQFARNE